ncbi:glycosyltransferase [bacterium]|nr:glycosyltransferase [bacterium]
MPFTIANLMFAKGKGGLEQAFVDHAEAELRQGAQVHAIADPECPHLQHLRELGVNVHTLRQHGPWDIGAARRLKQLLQQIRPDVIVGHGNRAIALTTSLPVRLLASMPCPVVGVAHNYRIKRFNRLDGAIAITRDLKKLLGQKGVKADRLHHAPNMVRLPELDSLSSRPWNKPPVIGTMGRMVTKKGFHRFLEALSMLVTQGTPFHAHIGGEGPELEKLKAQAAALKLDKHITWLGWVENKEDFFQSIDIFCLPSLHEPFGIVLLEAMSYGLPVVSTSSEGPREILHHGKDGLVVGPDDARALMTALNDLLQAPEMAVKIGMHARHTVERSYAMDMVGQRLITLLRQIADK